MVIQLESHLEAHLGNPHDLEAQLGSPQLEAPMESHLEGAHMPH